MASQLKRRIPTNDGYDYAACSSSGSGSGCHSAPNQSEEWAYHQSVPGEHYSFLGYHNYAKRLCHTGTQEAAVVEETRAISFNSAPTGAPERTTGVESVPGTTVDDFRPDANVACFSADDSAGSEPRTWIPAGELGNPASQQDAVAPSRTLRSVSQPWIPLLISLEDETITAWDLDPKAVEEAVRSVGGNEGVITVKITATGCFVVHVRDSATTLKLQRMKTLLGAAVDVRLSTWYTRNMAKIRTVPLYVTDGEMLEELEPAGVMSARRAVSYTRLDNGTCLESPKSTVILVFAPEVTELPTTVTIDGDRYKVEACQRTAMQCMNCFGFGHQARRCQSAVRCKLCAGFHHHHHCRYLEGYVCVNCGGGHAATYSFCPAKERAVAERNGFYCCK